MAGNILAIQRCILLGTLVIFQLLCADGVDTTMSRCVYGDMKPLSLDDAIHVSDVVLTGRILSMRDGERGTMTATVYYYYAYKRDQYLRRLGLARTDVKNFPQLAESTRESALFFLVREPDGNLALQCMTVIVSLASPRSPANIVTVLNRVKTVGEDDNERNKKFVPPDPNPCDSVSTNPCSAHSHCSVMNTLPRETVRCTCLTGYVGDGRNCTVIPTEPPTTEPPTTEPLPIIPSSYECDQCLYGALCLATADKNIICDCSHAQCTGEKRGEVCGSDGRTYVSQCELELETCLSQRPVFLLHSGSCKLQTVRPCGGMTPPLTTPTGLVRCKADSCPSMHFCHTTDLFSVCCHVTPPTTTSFPQPSSTIPTMSTTVFPEPTGFPGSGSASGSGFDDLPGSGSGFGVLSGSGEAGTLVDDEDWNRNRHTQFGGQ